jgi:hypothetical protein
LAYHTTLLCSVDASESTVDGQKPLASKPDQKSYNTRHKTYGLFPRFTAIRPVSGHGEVADRTGSRTKSLNGFLFREQQVLGLQQQKLKPASHSITIFLDGLFFNLFR